MHTPSGHIQLFTINMIETATIVICCRQIINVIHDGVRAPKAMAARQCRNANADEYDIKEGTHERPFPAEILSESQ